MQKEKIQMSETFRLGALLAVGGGFLDAYTYVCRGGVFANAQTGNMVLLGLHVVRGEWMKAVTYLIPVLAFALGVVLTEIFRAKYGSTRLHWRQLVVLFEALLLVLVAFLPLGTGDMTANVLVSFVCAVQVETFRKMKSGAYATTMCTGNLRSGTELFVQAVRKRDRQLAKRGLAYYGIILVFIIGAGIGVLLTETLGPWAVLTVAGVLVGVFGMMFF